MSFRPLLLTAHLATRLAGDPPRLDGLLEALMSLRLSSIEASRQRVWDRHRITRTGPAPPQGQVPIPLRRAWLGDWLVACCSDPIMPVPLAQTVEYVTKRLAVECAPLLREPERKVVSTTNSWTKSYRLPLRVGAVPCVHWLCVGDRRELIRLLRKGAPSIGKKVSDGYGRVREWVVEHADADFSWFAEHPDGTVLMRAASADRRQRVAAGGLVGVPAALRGLPPPVLAPGALYGGGSAVLDTQPKRYTGLNVLEAALERLTFILTEFPRVYVSFSGGKDSGLLLHLCLRVAQQLNRLPLPVLFVDLEAQYRHTVAYAERTLSRADVEPYWVCLPLHLRNAVSQTQPHWLCWDENKRDAWVRSLPNRPGVISASTALPFFRRGMEFEEFVPAFGEWFARGERTCCLVGIRTDESLNRFRTIRNTRKEPYAGRMRFGGRCCAASSGFATWTPADLTRSWNWSWRNGPDRRGTEAAPGSGQGAAAAGARGCIQRRVRGHVGLPGAAAPRLRCQVGSRRVRAWQRLQP